MNMKPIRCALAVVASLSFVGGCVSDEDGALGVVDSGVASFIDAGPPVVTPDAAIVVVPDAGSSSGIDAGGGLPGLACTLDEVTPLLTCASENCLMELGTPTATTCLLLNCGTTVLGLSTECSGCILTAIADSSQALDACVSGVDSLGLPTFP